MVSFGTGAPDGSGRGPWRPTGTGRGVVEGDIVAFSGTGVVVEEQESGTLI